MENDKWKMIFLTMKDSLLCTHPISLPLSRRLRAMVALKAFESKANTHRAKRSRRAPGLPASSQPRHDAQDRSGPSNYPTVCGSIAPNRHPADNEALSRPTAFGRNAFDDPKAHDETTAENSQGKYPG